MAEESKPIKIRREMTVITAKDGVPTIIMVQGKYYTLMPPNYKLPATLKTGK